MIKNIHYSKELEAAILGAILIERDAMGRVYGLITEQCFYSSDNQAAYKCMLEMYNDNLPIDCVTLTLKMEELQIKLAAGEIGWYVTTLTNSVVSSANMEYHSYLLNEMWKKREVLKITQSGTDSTLDSRGQLQLINKQLQLLQTGETKHDWYSMDELMMVLVKHHEELSAGTKKMITTGFKALDKENGGFASGQMVVVAARPSVGKSALMGKIAISQAIQGHKVGIISLEMNNVDIASRLTSLETDIEFWRIHRNLFTDESQQQHFYNIVSTKTAHLPIYISDKTKVDIMEIKAKAAKLKHKHGLDVLMIDYMQLVDGTGERNYNREQEVAKISRGMKILAMEMEMPIIVLCQLNRNSTQRTGKERYPRLSDLRESGAIEQDADVVLMLHRDWMSGIGEDENGNSTERQADLLAVKWRNGALCQIPLEFDPQKMKFNEIESHSFIPIRQIEQRYTPTEDDEPF